MTGRRVLSQEAVAFRKLLIDALWTDAAFGYVNEDVFFGVCPVCGDAVNVHFHGYATRATLQCQGGCSEPELADKLGLGAFS